MALIKCEECGESISSSAKVCPHCGVKINLQTCPECGAKLNGDETSCPECGYPVGKKNASNIITENLDKITGAQSKSYVKFKDLFKNTLLSKKIHFNLSEKRKAVLLQADYYHKMIRD